MKVMKCHLLEVEDELSEKLVLKVRTYMRLVAILPSSVMMMSVAVEWPAGCELSMLQKLRDREIE